MCFKIVGVVTIFIIYKYLAIKTPIYKLVYKSSSNLKESTKAKDQIRVLNKVNY